MSEFKGGYSPEIERYRSEQVRIIELAKEKGKEDPEVVEAIGNWITAQQETLHRESTDAESQMTMRLQYAIMLAEVGYMDEADEEFAFVFQVLGNARTEEKQGIRERKVELGFSQRENEEEFRYEDYGTKMEDKKE